MAMMSVAMVGGLALAIIQVRDQAEWQRSTTSNAPVASSLPKMELARPHVVAAAPAPISVVEKAPASPWMANAIKANP